MRSDESRQRQGVGILDKLHHRRANFDLWFALHDWLKLPQEDHESLKCFGH